ncbi:hypothetical protein MWH28_06235 [Natroniella sulfidigena]|uniref:hypothetical protein n=1 Tax=Natroniella sulfidigena TaxID=723921 RepID=UPI00200A8D60|nr:hypothetical protein [Natroniella sulfidigena]MCK8816971.1 hypothetical protein [Natroniella sulfidigena]
MKKDLFSDPIALGSIAGIVGNIPKEILAIIFYSFGWKRYTFTHLAAGLFVPKEFLANPLALIVGFVTDFTVAGLLGVLLAYIIKNTGNIYPTFKGLLIGLVSYIFICGLILKSGITSVNSAIPLAKFSALLLHIIFGIVSGWFIKCYGKLEDNK